MARPTLDLSVYLVTDTALCGGPDGVVSTVRDAVASGVTVVQLRDPDAPDDDFVALGRRLVEVLDGTGVPLIVNDRVHLVDAIGAQGAHIGQGDLSILRARTILGSDKLLGLSVSSPDQVSDAVRACAGSSSETPSSTAQRSLPEAQTVVEDEVFVILDYLGAQSLHATGTKPEAGEVGLDVIASCVSASPWPVVAIGGVKASDAADLRRIGCAGMAVVSAICGRPDVPAATRGLVDAWSHITATSSHEPPPAPHSTLTPPSVGTDARLTPDVGRYHAPRPVQEDR